MDEMTLQLVPSTLEDKRLAFNWLCNSDVSASMFGFDGSEKPSWEEFCEDYLDCYFDGTDPEFGRVFMIVSHGQKIGCISYCCFHLRDHMAELDIWMGSEAHCGKGYGTQAISTLCDDLVVRFGITHFIIRPSRKNIRAVKAYKKAGFVEVDKEMEEQVVHRYLKDEYYEEYGAGDYGVEGTVTLVREN